MYKEFLLSQINPHMNIYTICSHQSNSFCEIVYCEPLHAKFKCKKQGPGVVNMIQMNFFCDRCEPTYSSLYNMLTLAKAF